jgi:hypothetical protein
LFWRKSWGALRGLRLSKTANIENVDLLFNLFRTVISPRPPSAVWWSGWRGRKAANGLWKLSLSRPEEGRVEDFRVDMTGACGILFLSPDKHW